MSTSCISKSKLKSTFILFLVCQWMLSGQLLAQSTTDTGVNEKQFLAGLICFAGALGTLLIPLPTPVLDIETSTTDFPSDRIQNFGKPLKLSFEKNEYYGNVKWIKNDKLLLGEYKNPVDVTLIKKVMDLESAANISARRRLKTGLFCVGSGVSLVLMASALQATDSQEKSVQTLAYVVGVSCLAGAAYLAFVPMQDENEWSKFSGELKTNTKAVSDFRFRIEPSIMGIGAIHLNSGTIYSANVPCISARFSF